MLRVREKADGATHKYEKALQRIGLCPPHAEALTPGEQSLTFPRSWQVAISPAGFMMVENAH